MTINNALFSSKRPDWETPWDFFSLLDFEFDFTLDVCASDHNAKVDRYYTLETDGLTQSWAGENCWMNPPYGKEIGKWVKKAHMEARQGALVVGLLPARTDTKWFHDHVYHKAAEIRFVKGRLKFEGASSSAPFPSIIVVWKK